MALAHHSHGKLQLLSGGKVMKQRPPWLADWLWILSGHRSLAVDVGGGAVVAVELDLTFPKR